jgi:hypothetical protein
VIRERRKPKRKEPGFQGSTSLIHPEQSTASGELLSRWRVAPVNSWQDRCEKGKDGWTVKKKAQLK